MSSGAGARESDPVQYRDVCAYTFTGTYGPVDDLTKGQPAKVQSCGDKVRLVIGGKVSTLNGYMPQEGVWSFQSNLDFLINYLGRPPAGLDVKPNVMPVSSLTPEHTDLGLRLPDSAAAVILFLDQDGREVYWMPDAVR
jgi:hypothetical protein